MGRYNTRETIRENSPATNLVFSIVCEKLDNKIVCEKLDNKIKQLLNPLE